MRKEFVKFYKDRTGDTLNSATSATQKAGRFFVLSNQDNVVQIIEIKQPNHKFGNEELDRLVKYRDLMREFINTDGHQEFKALFPDLHLTLVCDGLNLGPTY